MISPASHSSAGASSSVSNRRRTPAAPPALADTTGVSDTRTGGGEAERPLRIEAEIHARAGPEICMGAGLRKRDAQLAPTPDLSQHDRRVGPLAVEFHYPG